MPIAKIEPTDKHPIPYSLDADEPEDYLTQVLIAGNTADVLEQLGAPLEVDDSTFHKEKALITAALKGKDPNALRKYPTALAASAFVKRYGMGIAHEVSEVRTALTNKLLEIADCGDIKHELRAIELLGKHVDIGLFTERSELTVNYKDPESLEKAIKERVKRLLNADIIDVTSVGLDLDEELGIFAPNDEIKDGEGGEPDA
jgi:hypothetical protein